MNDTIGNRIIKCPRCGKYIDLTEASIYVSEHTDTKVAGRNIITSNYTRNEIMCRSCAFYRNHAEKLFEKLIWVLTLVISIGLIFISYAIPSVTGGILSRIVGGVLIGALVGVLLTEFIKYCFYAYDNIKMYFVRKMNKQ